MKCMLQISLKNYVYIYDIFVKKKHLISVSECYGYIVIRCIMVVILISTHPLPPIYPI